MDLTNLEYRDMHEKAIKALADVKAFIKRTKKKKQVTKKLIGKTLCEYTSGFADEIEKPDKPDLEEKVKNNCIENLEY